MGVPAFFRWLSRKYPSIVVQADDGTAGQYHFDNLYLDMNGIIHPCSHPENKPPPANEEEMFLAIFEYVEDILAIVRPKKVLYMAVDGVAPRAKMNQQRSRRFRAAQEATEKAIEVQKVKDSLAERGIEVKEKEKREHFDSNVITPGTEFMMNLSEALRGWIVRRLSEDYVDKAGIWPKDLVVILSDASVPGEGEHKIMDYIRKQKADCLYNPNLSHCLYGADADLIMLGLATHEPNFTILREEFKPNQPRPCDLCGQIGHELKDCTGAELPPEDLPVPAKTDFIYIRLNVLREYLEKECQKGNVRLDFERFIDDYVFLCFFVGNDFLPHLPSLEIRENAIDRLINIYKFVLESQPVPEGEEMYLTKSGIVNKPRAEAVLLELGEVEDEIFKNRQRSEKRWRENNKRRKLERMNADLRWMNPQAVGGGAQRPEAMVGGAAKEEAAKVRANYHNQQNNNNNNNDRLNSMLVDKDKDTTTTSGAGIKRPLPSTPVPATVDSDSEPEDLVQLHSDGWKERYYQHKFDCDQAAEISRMVAAEYFKGLCWVLLYYYQGCPDWKWFFPYHYAPFASDFGGVASLPVVFDPKAAPFKPMEQLMSVFPAASSKSLPPSWRVLMSSNSSPIIDFYPTAFSIDLNGKKAAWMGVALLPFIDEERLFRALQGVYDQLTEGERLRNSLGAHLVFVSRRHPLLTKALEAVIDGAKVGEAIPMAETEAEAPSDGSGKYRLMAGKLSISDRFSAAYRRVLVCEFEDPKYEEGFVYPARLLPTAAIPPAVLKPQDLAQFEHYRPQIGMNRRGDQASLDRSGHRTFERSIQRDYGGGGGGNSRGGQGYHNQYGYESQSPQSYRQGGGNGGGGNRYQNNNNNGGNSRNGGGYGNSNYQQNDRRNYGGGGNGGGGGGGGNYRNNGNNNNSYNSGGGNNRGNNGHGGGQYPQRSNYQQQQHQQSYGGHQQQQQYHQQQAQQRSNYSSGSYYNNASSNYPTSSNYGGQHSYQQSYGGGHYQQQPPQQSHSYAQQSYYGQPQSYAAAAPGGANAPRQAPYSAAAIPQYYTSDYVPKGGGASGSNVGNGNAAAADKYRQQNYKRY